MYTHCLLVLVVDVVLIVSNSNSALLLFISSLCALHVFFQWRLAIQLMRADQTSKCELCPTDFAIELATPAGIRVCPDPSQAPTANQGLNISTRTAKIQSTLSY